MVFSQQSGLIEISKQETDGSHMASSHRMIRIENICARLQKQTEAKPQGAAVGTAGRAHSDAASRRSVERRRRRVPGGPSSSAGPVLLRLVLLAILTPDFLEMKGKLTKCLTKIKYGSVMISAFLGDVTARTDEIGLKLTCRLAEKVHEFPPKRKLCKIRLNSNALLRFLT